MQPDSLLIRSVRNNAVFSAVSALTLFALSDWIAMQLGIANIAWVYSTAAALLLFSLQLANIVRSKGLRRWEISAVIAADIGWVIGSVVLSVAFYPAITMPGLLLITAVAMAVLYLAVQQFRGLRKIPASAY